jgi:hypothetical protein
VAQANFAGRLHPSQRKLVRKSLPVEVGAIVVGVVWTVLAKPAAAEKLARYGNVLPDVVGVVLGVFLILVGLWPVAPRMLEALLGRVYLLRGRLERPEPSLGPQPHGVTTRKAQSAQSRYRVNVGIWSLPVDPRLPITARPGQDVAVFYTPLRGRVVAISPAATPETPIVPELTEADRANFEGRLHRSQHKYLRRGFVWPLVWLALGVFYAYLGFSATDQGELGVAAAAVLLFLSLRMTYRKVREIRAGRVEQLGGNPLIEVNEGNFSGLAVQLRPGPVRKLLSAGYVVVADGRRFRAGGHLRVRSGLEQTVFVTPRLRRVVNIADRRR